ncbi:zinc-binding alcohol dehydrogenase-like protein [Penicillium malachiteum]|uniref:zinc-binding alcohol dehydrogenase-like protein n=1 Tax=Penicillium malachiteum TaxID=1324776 RepID=UPI00254854E9|nr:zinc-binding alcohol dehydrogenase-like protein [Penicillium malachiteum]KAJ5735986.1 zinc-binding alcohol dehydrogenase-like protein [Penicillium malachiteum]
MPAKLDFLQASTLTCSGLTAWNALFGVEGYKPRKGDWVLVQGTGGVSIAALQVAFHLASVDSQIADFEIFCYCNRSYGETAKNLTPEGEGVHIVVDVGGLSTLAQSLKAISVGGLLVLAVVLGKLEDGGIDSFYHGLSDAYAHEIEPVIDDRVFEFEDVKAAYGLLERQQHFSKRCIRIQHE